MSTRKKKADEKRSSRNVFVFRGNEDPAALAAGGNVINPPGPPQKDRSAPDRERYRDRQKGKAKKKIGDILSGEPVITRPGKIKIPVDGGYEPIWRPGRDGSGKGPGKGKKAGNQPGEYIEVTWEEFVQMFFDAINLPNLLKKQFAQTLVKTHKRRGTTNVGPKARLNKKATAVARLKRASAMKNASPEQFVEDFAGKCQAAFEAYVFWAASGTERMFPEPVYKLIGDEVEDFLSEIEMSGGEPLIGDEVPAFRSEVVEAVKAHLASDESEDVAPYTVHADLKIRIESYVYDKERAGEEIPTVAEVPFHKTDMRYNRVEERDDPDSKAVVFLVLDRSGSMSGDPLVIAKAYFLINVLFLRTKYKEVAIVMISHDAQDYLWKTEEEFFRIGAGGGTIAAPAWELVYKIAEFGATCRATGVSAPSYPRHAWNRYMFHATDGALFDGDDVIRHWWGTKILKECAFNYTGYLEIGSSWGGWGGTSGYDYGGQALLGLPPELKARLGMAKANSLADVPAAFTQILDKDKKGA